MSTLKASLGFKGEKGEKGEKGDTGKSAYEIAVENGFEGTEQDWLASIGTSSYFDESKVLYTATSGQTTFDLPEQYTTDSFIDVYSNGSRLNLSQYTVNSTTKKVTLTTDPTANDKIEIVCLTMSTNSLPIVSTLSSKNTNNEAAGAKVVYDRITNIETKLSCKMDNSKFSSFRIATIEISVGETLKMSLPYPSEFVKINTVIVAKEVSGDEGNTYYDMCDAAQIEHICPIISKIILNDSTIDFYFTNNTNEAKECWCNIALMKI